MALSLVFLPDAQNDLVEIFNYYESKSVGLGDRFIGTLDKRLYLISESPGICPIRYDTIRCSLVPDFPYLIHYEIDFDKSRIIVYRIFHTSRKPLWDDE
jgi:plasmid stabilization system protein ParE